MMKLSRSLFEFQRFFANPRQIAQNASDGLYVRISLSSQEMGGLVVRIGDFQHIFEHCDSRLRISNAAYDMAEFEQR